MIFNLTACVSERGRGEVSGGRGAGRGMEYERSLETLHSYTRTVIFSYQPGLVHCHGENQATTDLPLIQAAKQFRGYLLPPPV